MSSSNSRYGLLNIEAFASKFYRNADGSPRQLVLTPYGYPVTFLAVAPAVPQVQQINIAANADFILLAFHHRASIGAAQAVSTKVAPFCNLLITDNGTGEQYTNVGVDLENYSSNGSFLQELSYPRIIAGKSSLQIQVTNTATFDETYDTLQLFLEGVQVRAY